LRMNAKRYLAIDIGGAKIEGGLITNEGSLLGTHRVPARPFCTREEFLADIAAALAPFAGEPAAGVGVGIPLLGDYHRGILKAARSLYPSLDGFALREHLERTWGLPVMMTTDANMLALGVARFGEGRRHGSFIALTIGTGVGIGLIQDGRLVEGPHGPPEDGLRILQGSDRGRYHAGHFFPELYGCNGETLAARAASGNAPALAAFETVGTALSDTVRRLLSVYRVEAVVLAGGICQSWRFFREPLRRGLEDVSTAVVRTELPHPALLGGAALFGR